MVFHIKISWGEEIAQKSACYTVTGPELGPQNSRKKIIVHFNSTNRKVETDRSLEPVSQPA